MELNKQAISEIDNYILKNYDGYPHYKKLDVKENMITALTNPEIYEKAGLISLEDAMGFAEWYAGQDTWEGDRYREVSEMFQIYKQHKL